MRDTKHTETARQLWILRAVGFLIFLNSCSRGTAQGVAIRQKMFYQLSVTATIENSICNFTGLDLATCADSCVRNEECVAFSLEIWPNTTVCQLGSQNFAVLSNLTGMSATLFYAPSVPSGYTFAMITDKLHFLKALTRTMNYTTGLAACKADGADHLVQDDKGPAWHNFVLQYSAANAGGKSWYGGDDLDGDHIYNWNDGTLVSASVQTFWNSGEPTFSYGGQLEQCMGIGYNNLWYDFYCRFLFGVICEIRLP
ncbi:unnamed protein product [Darwinula stevensoni]|uniref:C-type lectin domain-containing protein n=1 Tax=Darwinula stevensoni TaxID=69355 RepID=A0A7R9AAD6_9CRUS|nr:unnamed protein product [Darwinula stevensoni]CAG0898073.1 unnamed protein product [Darwinula stevensoni]